MEGPEDPHLGRNARKTIQSPPAEVDTCEPAPAAVPSPMSARHSQKPADPRALAQQIAAAERELSRRARESLEGAEGPEAWFGLVEQAVVQLRRMARELECLPALPGESPSSRSPEDAVDMSDRKRCQHADNVLIGHASVASVSEVLGFLSAMGKSGVLWVDVPQESFLVQLKDGAVVYAQGNNPPGGQRLGEILVRQGALDTEEMRLALREASEANEVLGGHMVRKGTITAAQLSRALAEQAQMIFHRMFGNPEASYHFEDGVRMVDSQDVRLNVIQLLLESARVSDEGRMHLQAGVPVSLARCD